MIEEIKIDPKDPKGKKFIGRQDYGDDTMNLFGALTDLIGQVGHDYDAPATFDKNLKFIDTITFANAQNTYEYYLNKLVIKGQKDSPGKTTQLKTCPSRGNIKATAWPQNKKITPQWKGRLP